MGDDTSRMLSMWLRLYNRCGHSLKKSSVFLHRLFVREGNPRWHNYTCLYFLSMCFGSYLSTSCGSVFTHRTALLWNPPKRYCVGKVLCTIILTGDTPPGLKTRGFFCLSPVSGL